MLVSEFFHLVVISALHIQDGFKAVWLFIRLSACSWSIRLLLKWFQSWSTKDKAKEFYQLIRIQRIWWLIVLGAWWPVTSDYHSHTSTLVETGGMTKSRSTHEYYRNGIHIKHFFFSNNNWNTQCTNNTLSHYDWDSFSTWIRKHEISRLPIMFQLTLY